MIYKARIEVYGDKDKIYAAFKNETGKKDRSEMSIKKQEKSVLFEINAKDSVALRAAFNSLTKLFTVYEKIMRL